LSRAEAERRGRRAEHLAAWWLRLHGWRILGMRVRTTAGEVDIVARRWRTVAFVEVKQRADREARDISLDRRRLVRVARSAEALASRFAGPGDTIRIDAVLLAPGLLPRHLTNVWQG
jgi:putative endonuclease